MSISNDMRDVDKVIAPHFELNELQRDQFEALGRLYRDWNSKINLISRKDLDDFYVRHVLHSLAIAKIEGALPSGSQVLDVGTGGGFPGIPLAILFPEVQFTLCDSIGKKIRVIEAVAKNLGLKNVETAWARAEDLEGPWDLIVSRAVARMPIFLDWVTPLGASRLLYLKGGDLSEELAGMGLPYKQHALGDWFDIKRFVAFEDKCIVDVQLKPSKV